MPLFGSFSGLGRAIPVAVAKIRGRPASLPTPTNRNIRVGSWTGAYGLPSGKSALTPNQRQPRMRSPSGSITTYADTTPSFAHRSTICAGTRYAAVKQSRTAAVSCRPASEIHSSMSRRSLSPARVHAPAGTFGSGEGDPCAGSGSRDWVASVRVAPEGDGAGEVDGAGVAAGPPALGPAHPAATMAASSGARRGRVALTVPG